MSSAGPPGACTFASCGAQEPAHPPCFAAWSHPSLLELFLYHVSFLPLQSPVQHPTPVLWNKPFWCSGLFLVSQLISRFSSQNHTDLPLQSVFFLPVICTACPYLMLCFNHICVILISPISLGLNLPHSSHWWLCQLLPLLVSGSITFPSSLFSFVSGVYY